MTRKCPACKEPLTFVPRYIPGIEDHEGTPWLVASTTACPKCKYSIGLGWFESEDAAKAFIEGRPYPEQLELTGT